MKPDRIESQDSIGLNVFLPFLLLKPLLSYCVPQTQSDEKVLTGFPVGHLQCLLSGALPTYWMIKIFLSIFLFL